MKPEATQSNAHPSKQDDIIFIRWNDIKIEKTEENPTEINELIECDFH
jgi:hypothetical protein